MIKTSKLEKALGGKLENRLDRQIPGLNDSANACTIYFNIPNGKSAEILFRKITNFTNPPFAQSGGANESGCVITTPSNLVFHSLKIHGDLIGWGLDIEAGAASENILLAKICDEDLKIEDGQGFTLKECQITFI